MGTVEPFIPLCRVGAALWVDLARFLGASLRSRTALAAENLFLRKQLALYRERQVNPRRASDPIRLALVLLARCFAWREALTIVRPATLIRWHRDAFRLLWRWRSRPGRPRLPADLQRLIAAMARSNPTWGEERIAAELLVKLGIRVSPRTVRRYMARGTGGGWCGAAGQRWGTFVRNHARALVACDFCVAVTATFRVLYVFVALEVGSRRLVHVNVTSHPTAAWTLHNSGKSSRRRMPTDSSSTIATVSTRPGSTPPSPRWVSGSSAPRSRRPRRTRFVSACSEAYAGSAWTS